MRFVVDKVTQGQVFLPVLQFPVSIIPPMLYTHSFYIYNIFLPVLQLSPVSIIPPMLHARLHCARTHGLYLGTFQKAIRCF